MGSQNNMIRKTKSHKAANTLLLILFTAGMFLLFCKDHRSVWVFDTAEVRSYLLSLDFCPPWLLGSLCGCLFYSLGDFRSWAKNRLTFFFPVPACLSVYFISSAYRINPLGVIRSIGPGILFVDASIPQSRYAIHPDAASFGMVFASLSGFFLGLTLTLAALTQILCRKNVLFPALPLPGQHLLLTALPFAVGRIDYVLIRGEAILYSTEMPIPILPIGSFAFVFLCSLTLVRSSCVSLPAAASLFALSSGLLLSYYLVANPLLFYNPFIYHLTAEILPYNQCRQHTQYIVPLYLGALLAITLTSLWTRHKESD
jgi:hypothetical protein